MYASHRQLLRRAEDLRHRRNIISDQYSSAKVLGGAIGIGRLLFSLLKLTWCLAVRCRKGETGRGRC